MKILKEFQLFFITILIIGLGFTLSLLSYDPKNYHVTWLITALILIIVFIGYRPVKYIKVKEYENE
jgi:hypothetical protein